MQQQQPVIDDQRLLPILEKVRSSQRLSFDDGVTLWRSHDLLAIGYMGNLVRERHHGRIGRLASRLLAESLLRLVLGVALASGAVAMWAIATDRGPRDIMRNLLFAHGALAVAGLCVALLEAFGRWGWALLATLLGAITAIWLDTVLDRDMQPGLRILAGAAVCVVASMGPLFVLLREPDRNLAAAL